MTDPKLREAICCAIDPEAVNAVMNLGMGEVAQGLWPKSFPFYRDYYGKTLYDPEKAKKLLSEAGYAKGLTLELPVFSTFKDAATVVQENLRTVGVEVNVSVLDNATWTGLARGGDYDMLIGNTAIASVNATMFNHVDPAKSGISAYNIRVKTPELADALTTANSTDEAKQKEGFDKLYEEIFSKYYVLGLCNGDKYMAVKNGVTGLRVSNTYGFVDVTECHPE
ncbi:MAG: ABC transporter substrate-binding protein, partial [Ruthenibacterium sp.]